MLVRYSARNGSEADKFERLGGGTDFYAKHSYFLTFSLFLPYPSLCHCHSAGPSPFAYSPYLWLLWIVGDTGMFGRLGKNNSKRLLSVQKVSY